MAARHRYILVLCAGIMAVGVLVWTFRPKGQKGPKYQFVEKRVDASFGRFRLVTETHVPTRSMIGPPLFVIALEDTTTGNTIPLVTIDQIFQERSMRPELVNVAGTHASYTSWCGTIEVSVPTVLVESAPSAPEPWWYWDGGPQNAKKR